MGTDSRTVLYSLRGRKCFFNQVLSASSLSQCGRKQPLPRLPQHSSHWGAAKLSRAAGYSSQTLQRCQRCPAQHQPLSQGHSQALSRMETSGGGEHHQQAPCHHTDPLSSLLMGWVRIHHKGRSLLSSCSPSPSDKEQPLSSSWREAAGRGAQVLCASSQNHQQLCRLCCWASLPGLTQPSCPQSPLPGTSTAPHVRKLRQQGGKTIKPQDFFLS